MWTFIYFVDFQAALYVTKGIQRAISAISAISFIYLLLYLISINNIDMIHILKYIWSISNLYNIFFWILDYISYESYPSYTWFGIPLGSESGDRFRKAPTNPQVATDPAGSESGAKWTRQRLGEILESWDVLNHRKTIGKWWFNGI